MALAPPLFVSPKPDPHPDTTLLQPSSWNRMIDLLNKIFDSQDPSGSLLIRAVLDPNGADWLQLPNDTTKFLRGDGTFAVPGGAGTGDVTGPGSAVNQHLAMFSGTTGKIIADAGIAKLDVLTVVGGFPGTTTTFLRGDGTFATPAGGGTTVAMNATVTTVAENLASVTLLASNSNRQGFVIENDSDGVLLVKFGTTASSGSWTRKLFARDKWTQGDVGPVVYGGRIDGIWLSTPGSGGGAGAVARLTEITP